VCYKVLQCVAARPDPSALVGDRSADAEGQQMGGCVLQCVVVCHSVLQCVAARPDASALSTLVRRDKYS